MYVVIYGGPHSDHVPIHSYEFEQIISNNYNILFAQYSGKPGSGQDNLLSLKSNPYLAVRDVKEAMELS